VDGFGGVPGLIQLRRTHRNPKRIADYKGLRCRKGDACAWSGKAYWVAADVKHPLAGVEHHSIDELHSAIDAAALEKQ
jgi:hypothetical protein